MEYKYTTILDEFNKEFDLVEAEQNDFDKALYSHIKSFIRLMR